MVMVMVMVLVFHRLHEEHQRPTQHDPHGVHVLRHFIEHAFHQMRVGNA
jgi:hypothetical protein